LIVDHFFTMPREPQLGVTLSGMVMIDYDEAECRKAREEGRAAAHAPGGNLDQCPYNEQQNPILRANWQDAFVTARLYGGA
jgi:hypothetical protein